MNNITPEYLREILYYEPDTGVFTWLVSAGRRVSVGDLTGCMDGHGYLSIRIKRKLYKAHRLAWLYMTGEWPKDQIDHINHIRSDNRWLNLREANNTENQKNRTKRKDNASGVTGVDWIKADSIWRARIISEGERISLGRFTDKFEAICARMSANNKYDYHENHGR